VFCSILIYFESLIKGQVKFASLKNENLFYGSHGSLLLVFWDLIFMLTQQNNEKTILHGHAEMMQNFSLSVEKYSNSDGNK